MDPDNRICPFCAEVIPVKAKLCPYCHQWLTLKSFRHPLIMLLSHGIPALAFLAAILTVGSRMLEGFQNPKPYYSDFPASLKILDTRMSWVQTKDGLRIYLTGVLTNTSPVDWKDAEFDYRFFNAQGGMIDAGTGHGLETVCAHDDSAFRFSVVPTAATNEYASVRVSVSNARNTKSLF